MLGSLGIRVQQFLLEAEEKNNLKNPLSKEYDITYSTTPLYSNIPEAHRYFSTFNLKTNIQNSNSKDFPALGIP